MHMQRIVLGLAIAFSAIAPASSQEYRGTFEQQMACTPDVWRLCSDQVPYVERIVACLRQNTPQLSNNCRAVFDAQASAQQPAVQQPQVAPRGSQQAVPRGRTQQPQVIQPQLRPEPDDE